MRGEDGYNRSLISPFDLDIIMQELQWDPRISVFKQLSDVANGIFFEWYRIASSEEIEATGQRIIVDDILSEDELWKRLAID